MEQDVPEMAAGMKADMGHELPAQAIEAKVAGLLERGYPLSEEQIAAIQTVAGSSGKVAIIEGAAGSGKTTTLRPIADLYREHGKTIIATAVAWRTAVALGNDVDARPFCVDKLLRLIARAGSRSAGTRRSSSMRRGCYRPVRPITFSNSSNAMGPRSYLRAIPSSSNPSKPGPGLRLIRDGCGSGMENLSH